MDNHFNEPNAGLNLNNGTSGYGNEYNVGFSPGEVGGIPAGFNKFVYQQRLYDQMYGEDNRRTIAGYPLTMAAIWTPLGLVFSYVIFHVAWSLSMSMWSFSWLAGVIFFVGSWSLGGWLIYRSTIAVWLSALVLHRRRGGWLAPYLSWADQFNDLDQYAEYNSKLGHHHPDPNVRRYFGNP